MITDTSDQLFEYARQEVRVIESAIRLRLEELYSQGFTTQADYLLVQNAVQKWRGSILRNLEIENTHQRLKPVLVERLIKGYELSLQRLVAEVQERTNRAIEHRLISQLQDRLLQTIDQFNDQQALPAHIKTAAAKAVTTALVGLRLWNTVKQSADGLQRSIHKTKVDRKRE